MRFCGCFVIGSLSVQFTLENRITCLLYIVAHNQLLEKQLHVSLHEAFSCSRRRINHREETCRVLASVVVVFRFQIGGERTHNRKQGIHYRQAEILWRNLYQLFEDRRQIRDIVHHVHVTILQHVVSH